MTARICHSLKNNTIVAMVRIILIEAGVRVYFFFLFGRLLDLWTDGNGELSIRRIARGLYISCHSCHLRHWGEVAEHEYSIYNTIDCFVAFDQAFSPRGVGLWIC